MKPAARRDRLSLSLSLSLCSCALSMAAFADDVAIHEELSSYSANGGTLTVTFGLNTMTDGVGLIVIAAAEGTDNNRDVTSVTLDSSSATDLSFVEIGRIDGDDTGASNQNQQLTVWKLDNRAFGRPTYLWGETLAFASVDVLLSTVTIANANVANQFDRLDALEITGSSGGQNDRSDYLFDSATFNSPDTTIYLDGPPFLSGSPPPLGNLIAPAKTVQDFVNWWVNIFVAAWDIKF